MNVSVLIATAGETSSNGDPNPFLAALAGAVVGGLVSLATTLIVERVRTRVREEAQEEADAVTAKLAARLVHLELGQIEAMLRLALDRSRYRWPVEQGYVFPTTAWSAHAASLAARLPRESWEAVAAPYALFDHINLSDQGLSKDGARDLLSGAQNALRVLQYWTGDTNLPGWLRA